MDELPDVTALEKDLVPNDMPEEEAAFDAPNGLNSAATS